MGHSPYPKKLTVKVLCSDPATTYINDKKEKRELMNTVIADSSKVVKCVVYDAKKFHRFKAGTTIILRNIRKPDGIAVTSATVIFPAPKTLNLPPYMEKEGMAILHPPPCWCENCGRSFGISHENQSVRPRENHSGLYSNSSKKDTSVFFPNVTFSYYFLVML